MLGNYVYMPAGLEIEQCTAFCSEPLSKPA